jgi:hypothetical protein
MQRSAARVSSAQRELSPGELEGVPEQPQSQVSGTCSALGHPATVIGDPDVEDVTVPAHLDAHLRSVGMRDDVAKTLPDYAIDDLGGLERQVEPVVDLDDDVQARLPGIVGEPRDGQAKTLVGEVGGIDVGEEGA